MLGGPGEVRINVREQLGDQRLKPGTVKRIVPFALRARWAIVGLLIATALDAGITALSPLVLKAIIDDGILRHRYTVVTWLSLAVVGLALADAVVLYGQSWLSARIGQGLIYDLRTKVFAKVQRQPIAFFTRTQTGSLVSRLNTDVIGAQQAVTSLLSQSVSTVLTLVFVLTAMFYLSWQISALALLMVPLFLLPAKLIGRRLQRIARRTMELNAELGSMMNERFNVAGAMLVKLYGRADEEDERFADNARRVRDALVQQSLTSRIYFIVSTLLLSSATAIVYGLGGGLVIGGTLQIGTLVAMAAMLLRLYSPISQLSNMQGNVMTALVSFDRVFEVLDLEPLITERPDAHPLPTTASSAPDVEFDGVSFSYPNLAKVSLASLESVARRVPEKTDSPVVLREVSFRARPGTLTALVGPSGAGKTTIIGLVSRLYDTDSGAVRVDGHDVRDLTLRSLHDTVGVVTQDSHLFHDTIRANLEYARPGASEDELVEACRAAQIWPTIERLPDGLETVVGDRGHRLSGGEKQRLALARLVLKSPPVVVLDEATAHLDSESEIAIQRALRTVLAGRTSIVIAHRLSTIREADQILVVDGGRIRERGTHEELLAAGGLYRDLYDTQLAGQSGDGRPEHRAGGRARGAKPAQAQLS
jgi:ATP-binding cassette subfamily B protein